MPRSIEWNSRKFTWKDETIKLVTISLSRCSRGSSNVPHLRPHHARHRYQISIRGNHARNHRLAALACHPYFSFLTTGGMITHGDQRAPLWPKIVGAEDQQRFERAARKRYDNARHVSFWHVTDNIHSQRKERASDSCRLFSILLVLDQVQLSQKHQQEQ